MFDDSRPEFNGELAFYKKIRPRLETIFDVGSRDSSIFLDFPGRVHYFDPNPTFMDGLIKNAESIQIHTYQCAWFNKFGLGDENTKKYYYPRFESFHDRVNSCFFSDKENRVEFEIQRADEYIKNHYGSTEQIDFLKIDTEGNEYAVLLGFGDEIKRVKIIQFEYGGTWMDSYTSLHDVIEFLKSKGFSHFWYLDQEPDVLVPIHDIVEDYRYCNIVAAREDLVKIL